MLMFLGGVFFMSLGATVYSAIMRWYVRCGKDGQEDVTCPICGTDCGSWTEPIDDEVKP